MSDLVLLKQNSPTCVSIVLNRVDQHNALSIELINELQRVLNKIGKEAKQSKIRAIKILSASTKAFCAGADLKERLNMNDKQIISVLNKLKKLTDTVENFPVPVFAIIEGVAFGGGLELALACDFRMASPAAKVGLTETRLGIIPGAGGTQRLSRLIGESAAKEFIFQF
jgi:enoyl-CoA hydratase/carnithine racemase